MTPKTAHIETPNFRLWEYPDGGSWFERANCDRDGEGTTVSAEKRDKLLAEFFDANF